MTEATKPDKTRQLSIEQANAIEHLLQGQSDRAVAEVVGISRQTVWEWRKRDPLFIAELNRQRFEMWREARQEWEAKNGKHNNQSLDYLLDPALRENDRRDTEIEALANSKLKKVMAEAGLS